MRFPPKEKFSLACFFLFWLNLKYSLFLCLSVTPLESKQSLSFKCLALTDYCRCPFYLKYFKMLPFTSTQSNMKDPALVLKGKNPKKVRYESQFMTETVY